MLYLFIIIILFLLSLYRFDNYTEKGLLGLIFFVFWILATIRADSIGNDTLTYKNLFNYIVYYQDIELWKTRYEIAYLILNQIIGFCTDNFTIFLGIVNTFIYFAYYKFIKDYSKNKMLSSLLFFTLGFWGQTVNVIRLQLAIAMMLYAYFSKSKGNNIWAVVYSILAVLFHRLAWIYLIFWVIPKNVNRRFYFFATSLGMIVFALFPLFLPLTAKYFPYFQTYVFSNTYQLDDFKLASLLNFFSRLLIFSSSLFVFYNNRQQKDYEDFTQYINISFISLIILFISFRFNLLDRAADFFWVFSLILVPQTLDWLKNKNQKVFYFLIVVMFCIAHFSIINIYRPNWNNIYPYVTIFDEN